VDVKLQLLSDFITSVLYKYIIFGFDPVYSIPSIQYTKFLYFHCKCITVIGKEIKFKLSVVIDNLLTSLDSIEPGYFNNIKKQNKLNQKIVMFCLATFHLVLVSYLDTGNSSPDHLLIHLPWLFIWW